MKYKLIIIIWFITNVWSSVETVLHSFKDSNDGVSPNSLIQGADGYLYGTTFGGGGYNLGTIFNISTDGVYYILHNFQGGSDGSYPNPRLIQDNDGYFYGTTKGGGYDSSTLFKFGIHGTNYSMVNSLNIIGPEQSGIILGNDGYFYGTTYSLFPGGSVAFKIYKDGSNLSFIHTFIRGPDGIYPSASLTQGNDGYLYGTSEYGGLYGAGMLFKMSKDGICYSILYQFKSNNPILSLIQGTDGYLYGTTYYGGVNNMGTVFKIGTDGSNYLVLYNFKGGSNGQVTTWCIIQGTDRYLYGTTATGGSGSSGTVFQIIPSWLVPFSSLNN